MARGRIDGLKIRTPTRSVWLLMFRQAFWCLLIGLLLWIAYLLVARWDYASYWTGKAWSDDIFDVAFLYRTPAGDAASTPPAGAGVGQAVPAIVIAMFVFGVGTAFVVAQVVPPTRGTRAVRVVQGWRFGSTISPALTLLAASGVLLTEPSADHLDARSFAITLMAGSVVYVLWTTAALLSIYGDATNPESFRRLLEDECSSALRSRRHLQWRRSRQRRTDRVYELVRTIRGWTRVASTTGDSRELNEALTSLTVVTKKYAASKDATIDRCNGVIPQAYKVAGTNEHRVSRWTVRVEEAREPQAPTGSWLEWDSLARGNAEPTLLAKTWMANEVGRSLVRAVEYGLQTQNLLDRDLLRLLNTMAICCRTLSHVQSESRDSSRSSTWLFVRCFVEIGCQARNFPAQPEDWFHAPAIHLLHLYDQSQGELKVAIEAGLLLVVAAIISRRDPDTIDWPADARKLGQILGRHVATDSQTEGKAHTIKPNSDARTRAASPLLWPEGRPMPDVSAAWHLEEVHEALCDGLSPR